MKFTIIYPNFNDPYYPNIGLTNLATYITEKSSHKVNIVDLSLFKKNWKEVVSLAIKRTDAIGFTTTLPTIIASLEVARYIKNINNDIPIIFGGIYATSSTHELLEFDEIDYICVGEGELSIVSLLNALEEKKSEINIAGIWYRKNGIIIENGASPLVEDLDSLPFNNYDFWHPERIFRNINHFPILGARGCQYNCSFCTQSTLHRIYDKISNNHYHRLRSPKHICDELEFQFQKYKEINDFKGILFYDDTFTSNRQWVLDFCEEFTKRGLHLKHHWAINARMENMDKEILLTMKKAGCYYLYFGIESGAESVRKIYRKNFSENKIYNILHLAKQMGYRIKTYFIIDGPKETIEDNMNTLKLARKIKPDTLHIMPFLPLPNTYAAEIYQKSNPERFKYISYVFSPKNEKIIVEKTHMLISIVLGHMPESYLDLFRYVLMGLISLDKSQRVYAKIIFHTMSDYFISALKFGKLRFFKDLFGFLRLNFQFSLVTSDLFAMTLKKYLLEDSFKRI